MPNKAENLVQELNNGQAVFLGHSAVIANISGIRIGFDLCTGDGRMPSPFSNLAISGSDSLSHLIPLVDTQSQIIQPQEAAQALDVLIYSHLHADHFSLSYIASMREINPNLRIICPPNTKSYLHGIACSVIAPSRHKLAVNVKSILAKGLFAKYIDGVDRVIEDIKRNSKKREKLIGSIEEISSRSPMRIGGRDSEVFLSAFPTIHPAFQLYLKSPYEIEPPPPVLGYKITYHESDRQCSLMYIGEAASDPETLSHIFNERDRLTIVFLPITEQIESKGSQFLQEFAAHSSLRTLALTERIVSNGTKIVPLHQGLWYFSVTPSDIVKARMALEKLGGNKRYPLPFVAISREFQSISNRASLAKSLTLNKKMYVSHILTTLLTRWIQFKRLARIAVNLPISGTIVGFPPGTAINFGSIEDLSEENADFTKETLQSSIQAFLTEYQMLHQEIDCSWDWQLHIINYILLVIGSVLTLVSAFPNQEVLFLVASFILTSLGWTLIEKSIHMLRIGRYFLGELIPRINRLMQSMEKIKAHNPHAEKIKVLLWEGYFRGENIQTALLGFASWGRFSLAVVPGLAFAVAYFFIKRNAGNVWTPLETTFFILALSMSILPLAVAFLNAHFAFSGKQ